MVEDFNANIIHKGGTSFFIYCLNAMLVMGYCGWFMMKVIPSDNWFLASVGYMLIPLLCVAVCYTIYMIMNRYTPKLLAVLTGNRSQATKVKCPEKK